MNTPLLLIFWRRPDTLRQVINSLRLVKPSQIYAACDGPILNKPEEADKIFASREILEKEIDWPCTVYKLYTDINQGCMLGPIKAINWFFEHVEEGIILEDDCVPHRDFFSFCRNLLEHYRNDTRVWCISGNNFQNGQWRGDGSYYFSRYTHTWGWASWRRCWHHYDASLSHWPKLRDSGLLATIIEDPQEREYWSSIWEKTYQNTSNISWWDYQWMFTCLANSGLTAMPNRNLVSNIGFGVDATHTTGTSRLAALATAEINPILHPSFIVRDKLADDYTSKTVFRRRKANHHNILYLPSRAKSIFKKLFERYS